ncbi:MAG: hypothetical protein PF480_05405 [Roseovarius sp.]|jgi:hypothetical protein|nr:hypothetical protein [Roseovarius sp.]
MSDEQFNSVNPQVLTGLTLSPERFAEVAAAFVEIRTEIARMRSLDLAEIHPAVVFHPIVGGRAHEQ